MKAFIAVLLLNLSVTLPYAFAVSPADCNAVEHVAGKALDLVNKGRRDGYLFKLLRVADAHLEKGESSTVYYLALDVIESDCSVLSRKFWEDCELVSSRSPSHTVIGQCKVIATQWDESQNLRVKHFNCTTSSVSSALSNTKDSPVLVDFFEDTESYKKQAEKVLEKYIGENSDFASFKVDQVERVSRVRGEERTNYYIDFSVRNCSAFPRHSKIFGFCNALLSYDPGASDLETPKDTSINCEVFHTEEHRNLSSHHPFFGHHHHFGRREHSHEKMPPFRFRYRVFRVHHSHQPHTLECPPPGENQSLPSQTATPTAPFPSRSRCHHPHFDTNGTHGPPHNQSASEHHPHKNHSHPHGHHPHGHHPHGHHPHGHHPHGHHPHGHHPHGHHIHGNHSHSHHAHGQRPHGHHPHGHHPHGHHPHGHHPHGHHPHGHHPHGHHFPGHGFIDYGPCDPPSHRHGPQDHHHHGHGPPPRDSEERGPGRGNFPFHWGPFGYVYQLPPLKTGEFLPLPEANFTIIPLPHHNHSRPELQPFPQSTSESCPGKQQADFPRVSKFFEDSK